MSNIDLYDKLQNPIDAIDRIGEMFAKSGMFGCDKIEQGKVLAMACLSERKSPIQLNREYHIIEGKLSDRADSMLAKFRALGGKHRLIQRTPEVAEVELTLDGQTNSFRLTFEEVKGEPFVYRQDGKTLKKNWATPRARMQTLWARVISDGVRTMAPEIVAGVYTPEEIEDGEVSEVAEPKPLLKKEKEKVEKPATVVNVESQVVTPAPAPEAPPQETKPFAIHQVAVSPETGRLTVETMAALEAAIGDENMPAAIAWLKAKKWIENGISELSVDRAKRILTKSDAFIEAVKKGAAK